MKNLEIYIHIPFCVRKCEYCDFLSFPADDDAKLRYVTVSYTHLTLPTKLEV